MKPQTLVELLSNCIGKREFAVLSKETALDLLSNYHHALVDNFHLYLPPSGEVEDWTGAKVQLDTQVYLLYHLKDWRTSQERATKLKENIAREREASKQQHERIEQFREAMKLKGKQPSEIDALLTKVFSLIEPYYSLGVRYNLIDPTKTMPRVDSFLETINKL